MSRVQVTRAVCEQLRRRTPVRTDMSDFIFKSLLATRDRGVMHLTLNRPEARNAMNPQMLAELEIAIDAVRADREVRAIVLRGAGGHFCAGADLKSMMRSEEHTSELQSLMRRSYAVFCLQQKNKTYNHTHHIHPSLNLTT